MQASVGQRGAQAAIEPILIANRESQELVGLVRPVPLLPLLPLLLGVEGSQCNKFIRQAKTVAAIRELNGDGRCAEKIATCTPRVYRSSGLHLGRVSKCSKCMQAQGRITSA